MNLAAKNFLHSSFSIAGMAVAAFLAVTIWHQVTSRRPRKGVEYGGVIDKRRRFAGCNDSPIILCSNYQIQ